MNPIHFHSADTTSGQGLGSHGRNCAYEIFSKMNYDFLNKYLYLYLYLALRQILLHVSGIICIPLSSEFYYTELSVSGYPANLTIRAALVGTVLSEIICYIPLHISCKSFALS